MDVPTVEKNWVGPTPVTPEVAAALNEFPAYLRQVLFNRDILTAEDAHRFLDAPLDLADPFLLTDMQAAVDRLLYAIDHAEPIAVYGDYDVDGVTATALLVEVLRTLGGNAEAYIPNRFDEGYGLNNEALDTLAQAGVRLVVTVDCGIRSVAEAAHAQEIGLDMVITDHHHVRDELPEACAVVCPKRLDDLYPDANLAGVGLAFKLAQALFQQRPMEDIGAENWLELVALGTVADVVPLVGENRLMVRAGLDRMHNTTRQGLRSLIGAAGLQPQSISAGDISFGLAPRLNAAGRLQTALDAYDLLVMREVNAAGLLAQRLDDQNRERQALTQRMQMEAETLVLNGEDQRLLMAVDPGFNPGVVGLVAARLTETYYRPSIVGQRGEEFTRASCRSIPDFHITRALDECKELLVRHGGHAMAAGFTVRNENLQELSYRLQEIAWRELGGRELRPSVRWDVEVGLGELHPRYLIDLDRLQPTGLGNPEVIFLSRGVRPVRWRPVGAERQHLKLTLTDGRITYDAIAFRQGRWANAMPERMDVLYHFERNTFNGQVSLQLNIRDLKPSSD